MNHTVTAVGDGVEAVAAFNDVTYDAVLMDIQMPRMDGLEACRRMREIERARSTRTPVIAITAHAMDTHREECYRAGFDGFITKPVQTDEIVNEILRLTSTRSVQTGGLENLAGRVRDEVVPPRPVARVGSIL
jgi:CheY-like chemotaxis protein